MPPKPLTTAQKRLTRSVLPSKCIPESQLTQSCAFLPASFSQWCEYSEIKDMNEPDALPIGCQVFPNETNILQPWDAIITGPEGSAYEGGPSLLLNPSEGVLSRRDWEVNSRSRSIYPQITPSYRRSYNFRPRFIMRTYRRKDISASIF